MTSKLPPPDSFQGALRKAQLTFPCGHKLHVQCTIQTRQPHQPRHLVGSCHIATPQHPGEGPDVPPAFWSCQEQLMGWPSPDGIADKGLRHALSTACRQGLPGAADEQAHTPGAP